MHYACKWSVTRFHVKLILPTFHPGWMMVVAKRIFIKREFEIDSADERPCNDTFSLENSFSLTEVT